MAEYGWKADAAVFCGACIRELYGATATDEYAAHSRDREGNAITTIDVEPGEECDRCECELAEPAEEA